MKHCIDIVIALPIIAISILLGWWSTNGAEDVVAKISVNIITILLPLLVLHTTLVFHLLNETRKYTETHNNADYTKVLSSIKTNFIWEIIIILVALIAVIGKEYCANITTTEMQLCPILNYIILKSKIIANSTVLFSIFYFLWVIVDEIGGCLALFKENTKDS